MTENRIICLNSNGSKDVGFNTGTGFDSDVYSVVIQPGGQIIAGGDFTSYNGVTENRIIRLNSDGIKDASFNTGIGFNNRVDSMKIQADGKIIAGGWFTSYKGTTENYIIRLNSDGTKDTFFNSGISNGFVYAIALQANGKIILGGNFDSYNGITEGRIVFLNSDGTKDTAMITGNGFNEPVFSMVMQPDGKIIVGGLFTSYKGIAENRIIRLNSDGTKDTSFNTGTGAETYVVSLVVQPDGKIIVGGYFTHFNGVVENYIVRLNPDGSKDTSFNTGTGFNGYVNTIKLQPDGKIIVGGNFDTYKGINQRYIIRLNSDGTKDTSFSTGFNRPVYALALQPDGKIIVGGSFFKYFGITENYIIRLNSDGTKDTSFNTGTGFNNYVNFIEPQPNGKIIVGGQFTSYQGMTENRIIRLNADGTKDTSFNSGTGFNEFVSQITLQPNGKIIVCGDFTSYKGVTENYIIRLNADGTKDTSFNTGTGFNIPAWIIALKPDGKIILGGDFTTYQSDNNSASLIVLYGDSVLSNESFENQNVVSLYPNPVKDILNIDLLDNTSISSVKIYDLQGKLLVEKASNNIDVSNFSAGLYLIRIKSEKGEVTKKFIKE